jgi:cell division GTPase FtsZ
MSILVIGIGEASAQVADKINQQNIAGVNCATIVERIDTYENETTIKKCINIWNGEMRSAGSYPELVKKCTQDNIELIKALIVEGTNENWNTLPK